MRQLYLFFRDESKVYCKNDQKQINKNALIIDYDERCRRGFMVKVTRDTNSISAVITIGLSQLLIASETAAIIVLLLPVASLRGREGGGPPRVTPSRGEGG